MGKKLIINADDYGICRDVNTAIENLITSGKLTSVSVLANSLSYRDASAFLSDDRRCSIGVHLNIIEGVALSPSESAAILLGENGQFLSRGKLLRRWAGSPTAVSRAVETEWRAQIERMLNDGLAISHADSHQHLHAFPPFWQILSGLCREYGIPAVRLPRERAGRGRRRVAAFGLGQSANISKALFSNRDVISNDNFLGFKQAGSYGLTEMIADLDQLKDGVTELIVHPSLRSGVPYPELNGELEYNALRSPELWEHIEKLKIELITWADVAADQLPDR